MCSPLKPICQLLRVFQIVGGFPLYSQDDTWTTFSFWKWASIYHILTYGGPITFYLYVMVKVGLHTSSVQQLKSNWYAHGLTMVDLGAAIILLWGHVLVAFGFLRAFRVSAKPISKLCKILADQNKLLDISESDLRGITKRTYIAFASLYLFHILSVLTSYKYSQEIVASHVSNLTFIPLNVVWLIVIFIFYWPLPAAASFLVSRQCLMTLEHQLDIYCKKRPLSCHLLSNPESELRNQNPDCITDEVFTKSEGKIASDDPERQIDKKATPEKLRKISGEMWKRFDDPECKSSQIRASSSKIMIEPQLLVTEFIDIGFAINSSINIASNTLGCFLMLDICMCIFVSIIGSYFTPLIFDAFSHDIAFKVNYVKLSFGVHCFILAFKATMRWINYYRVGQRLAVSCQKVKTHLENVWMDEVLEKRDRSRIKLLIQRFDMKAPIRPWESFDLNLSTAISAASLVATYLVILIQFKQSNIDLTMSLWNSSNRSGLVAY